MDAVKLDGYIGGADLPFWLGLCNLNTFHLRPDSDGVMRDMFPSVNILELPHKWQFKSICCWQEGGSLLHCHVIWVAIITETQMII